MRIYSLEDKLLAGKYLQNGKPVNEIAKKFETSVSTITYWNKNRQIYQNKRNLEILNGIKKCHGENISEKEKTLLRKLEAVIRYKNGEPMSRVTTTFNIGARHLKYWCKTQKTIEIKLQKLLAVRKCSENLNESLCNFESFDDVKHVVKSDKNLKRKLIDEENESFYESKKTVKPIENSLNEQIQNNNEREQNENSDSNSNCLPDYESELYRNFFNKEYQNVKKLYLKYFELNSKLISILADPNIDENELIAFKKFSQFQSGKFYKEIVSRFKHLEQEFTCYD